MAFSLQKKSCDHFCEVLISKLIGCPKVQFVENCQIGAATGNIYRDTTAPKRSCPTDSNFRSVAAVLYFQLQIPEKYGNEVDFNYVER